SLGGIFVDIGADGGSIRRLQSKTSNNGEVRFTYRAPEAPGSYNLAARLEINNPTLVAFEVVAPENEQDFRANRRFLVEGATENSESSVTTFAGASATVRYPDQTLITLQGSPGERWSLPLDDYHLPNHEPVHFTRFENPRWDQLSRHDAEYAGVRRTGSPCVGIWALSFSSPTNEQEKSQWTLPSFDGSPIANPAYSFWLQANRDGDIL